MRNLNLFKIGITDSMDTEARRVTILTNVVYVILFFLLTGYLCFYLPDYLKLERLTLRAAIPWLAWLSVVAGIILNKLRLYLLSKLVFIVSWIILINILPTLLGNIRAINFFLYPLYCLVTSIIIHLMFSADRERIMYYFFTILIWVLIIFSFEFLYAFNHDVDLQPVFPNGFTQFRIIIIMLAAFFNAAIIYVIRINKQFYNSLQIRNDTISEQYKQLECQRKDLEELKLLLEQKVADRTQLLLEQNSKLREYTFFNSHILRAPVSRIRGLLYLLSIETSPDEEKRIRALLAEGMTELDQAIKSINDKLQQVELLEDPT